jgi:hypothetical protein
MFALALRAVSTVDAVWLAKRTAAAPAEPLSIGVEPMPRGFLLTLNKSF